MPKFENQTELYGAAKREQIKKAAASEGETKLHGEGARKNREKFAKQQRSETDAEAETTLFVKHKSSEEMIELKDNKLFDIVNQLDEKETLERYGNSTEERMQNPEYKKAFEIYLKKLKEREQKKQAMQTEEEELSGGRVELTSLFNFAKNPVLRDDYLAHLSPPAKEAPTEEPQISEETGKKAPGKKTTRYEKTKIIKREPKKTEKPKSWWQFWKK